MGFRLVKKETLTLNSREEVTAAAKRLQAMKGIDSERAIKNYRIARIKTKTLGGEARPFNWAVGRVPALGLESRVNGQHSSEMFLNLTDEEWAQVLFPILVDWEEYECETKKDLALLFEQFDPSWSSRSHEDIAGFHMGQYDHLKSLPRKLGEKLSAGLAWYAIHVERQQKTAGMQFEFFHSNHEVQPFLTWAGTAVNQKRNTELLNAPVVAAMYHTTRGNDEAARLFWKDLAKGYEALEDGSMASKLSSFLEAVKNPHYEWDKSILKQFRKGQYRPSDKDVFATCLRAVARAKKHLTLTEVFCASKHLTAAEIVVTHYPLPDTSAAA